MANGQQIAEQNIQVFAAWVASKADDDFRAMSRCGKLSRKKIAVECDFSKSVLDQNPGVHKALHDLEGDLRKRGVLLVAVDRDPDTPVEPLMREPSRLRVSREVERLRRLEQENASLKSEVAELKCSLEKHAVLREALALTGRLPR